MGSLEGFDRFKKAGAGESVCEVSALMVTFQTDKRSKVKVTIQRNEQRVLSDSSLSHTRFLCV